MSYLVMKALLSGALIAAISEIARPSPRFAAFVASLPLISILGMLWLWRDTKDAGRIAFHSEATFWYVLPSLPMFVILPWLLRSGMPFGSALTIGCAMTVALYFALVWLAPRFNLPI